MLSKNVSKSAHNRLIRWGLKCFARMFFAQHKCPSKTVLPVISHLFWRLAWDTEERLRLTACDVLFATGDIGREGFGEERSLWPPLCRIWKGKWSGPLFNQLKGEKVTFSQTCCTLACRLLVCCCWTLDPPELRKLWLRPTRFPLWGRSLLESSSTWWTDS